MQFAPPQALPRPLIRAAAMLLAVLPVGCAPIVIRPNAASCLALVPPSWSKPIPPVDLPSGETVGDWQVGFVGQTGQLEKANDRTADTLHIVGTCEGFQDAAVKRGSRGFVKRLFGG